MTQQLLTLFDRTGLRVTALALAAFAALFWALRGAPIGRTAREDDAEDAPEAGYRDRVVAAVVVGMLLIASGGMIALTQSIPWSLPLFAVGYGMVITLVAVNRRYRHS